MKLIAKCIVLTYNILKGGMHMTTVSLRFDDDMKRELDEICDEMGMNLTTFFTIYAKKFFVIGRFPSKSQHRSIRFTLSPIFG